MPPLDKSELQLRLLSEAAASINQGARFRELVRTLYAGLQTLLPCHRLAVAFIAGDGHTLITGPLEAAVSSPLKTGYREPLELTRKLAYERGEACTINDLQEYCDRLTRAPSTLLLFKAGLRSCLGVPVRVKDRLIGVLEIASRQRGAYTSGHALLLQTLASQLSIYFERARLISRLRVQDRGLRYANALNVSYQLRLDEVTRQRDRLQEERRATEADLVKLVPALEEALKPEARKKRRTTSARRKVQVLSAKRKNGLQRNAIGRS